MEPLIRDTVLIGSALDYTETVDPRHHLDLLHIQFFLPFTEENTAALSLLSDVIAFAHPKRGTERSLALWMKEYYDVSLDTSVSPLGDRLTFSINVEWLDDTLAMDGENITEAVLDWLDGLFFAPAVSGGGYTTPEFLPLRDSLVEYLQFTARDPNTRTVRQINAVCYRGEPCAIPLEGTPEDAAALTPQRLYALWNELLHRTPIQIYSVIPRESPAVSEWIRRRFGALERDVEPLRIAAPSPIKASPETVTAYFPDCTESTVHLVYKYKDAPVTVISELCDLLDDTAQSLLFTNLREKHSLCYSCYVDWEWTKNTLTLVCKTDAAHTEQVIGLLKEQIEILQQNRFSDALLAATEDAIRKERCEEWDQFLGIATQLQARRLAGLTPFRSFAELQAAKLPTREELTAAANALVLDTVFLAVGTAEEESHDE